MNSPVGMLLIAEESGAITDIALHGADLENKLLAEGAKLNETPLLKEAVNQLEEYFGKTRKEFDLPLAPNGTEFQKKDWQALSEIPYGKTTSYKNIAVRIGCPKGYRAVGMANNRNPIMIVIPCHRVIGSDGSLTGYEGGIHIKEYLLRLEGAL